MIVDKQPEIDAAFAAVNLELRQAMRKFNPMASGHEGYAVILEELEELWHEIKFGSGGRQREEAIQVAAMAIRFLVDVAVVVKSP